MAIDARYRSEMMIRLKAAIVKAPPEGSDQERDTIEACLMVAASMYMERQGIPFTPERLQELAAALHDGLEWWHWRFHKAG